STGRAPGDRAHSAHTSAVHSAAMVATPAYNTRAFADDLPPPSEPMLAERGDWAADFNQWQVACFRGSMSACDAIWLNRRVLQDSFLYSYGRTCGGRVSIGERRSLPLGRAIPPLYGNLSRAQMSNCVVGSGGSWLPCSTIAEHIVH